MPPWRGNMFTQERTQAVLEKLARATREGRLAWEETADEHTFRALLDNGMVQVSEPGPRATGPAASMRYMLYDKDNVLVAGGGAPVGAARNPLSTVLTMLYDLAK